MTIINFPNDGERILRKVMVEADVEDCFLIYTNQDDEVFMVSSFYPPELPELLREIADVIENGD